MKQFGFSGFCGAWQGASPNAVSEQSVDDCEPAIIQDGGFSVACNKVKCAKVTTKRNERNFLKKFLKWSYQVVTARKIQEEAQAGVEGKSLLLPETVDRRRRIIEPVKRQRSVVLQWRDTHRSHKKAFTLAEVLITLAIIGVVAAISIPSVISNSQQQEFKTGLRKAVSVLNQAITMNMALDGETPYDNADLFSYLQKHMAIVETFTRIQEKFYVTLNEGNNYNNSGFYTTDGMRFEFFRGGKDKALHETSSIRACLGSTDLHNVHYNGETASNLCGGCGSYGLNSNSDKTTKPPCLIMVDVNGDKKPTPNNAYCKEYTCGLKNIYKYSDALGLKLTDIFSIMITDKSAMPYGVAAQRAMYQARK